MLPEARNPEEVVIEHALAFLARADLKGGEVPAYVNVNNYLNDKLLQLKAQAAGPVPEATPET